MISERARKAAKMYVGDAEKHLRFVKPADSDSADNLATALADLKHAKNRLAPKTKRSES